MASVKRGRQFTGQYQQKKLRQGVANPILSISNSTKFWCPRRFASETQRPVPPTPQCVLFEARISFDITMEYKEESELLLPWSLQLPRRLNLTFNPQLIHLSNPASPSCKCPKWDPRPPNVWEENLIPPFLTSSNKREGG